MTELLEQASIDIWQIDLDDASWDMAIHSLSTDEVARRNNFRPLLTQQRYARCRAALRSILSHYTGIAPMDFQFRYGLYGKPFIESNSIRFNISHTYGLALFAFSKCDVGIDVELIDHSNQDVDALIASVGTTQEIERLNEFLGFRKNEKFYDIWTCKESFSKLVGTGLNQAFRNIEITPQQASVCKVGYISSVKAQAYCYRIDLGYSDIAASLCCESSHATILMRSIGGTSQTLFVGGRMVSPYLNGLGLS